MTECTKGRAEAERWPDPEIDPRWIIRLNDEIRFQTVGDNDEANAKEFARRWNAFEEGGLVENLVGACEAYKRHCELHDSSEHPKANMFCTECPRYRKQIEEALVEANTK